jgi:beta-glucosidase
MEVIAGTGKPVVLCMLAGSAIDLRYPAEHFNAVLQLWYPGARGGKSAAEILFGEVSPSGKLPITFYRDSDSLPDFTDYRMAGRTYRYIEEKPQYPFGYGLTYGDVAVTGAEIVGRSGKGDEYGLPALDVRVTAVNRGVRDTEDVLQLYLKNEVSQYAPKHPALCAFKRISVKAGESISVNLRIPGRAFTVVDDQGNRIVDGSHFVVFAGTSQPDERSIELTGSMPVKLEVCIDTE